MHAHNTAWRNELILCKQRITSVGGETTQPRLSADLRERGSEIPVKNRLIGTNTSTLGSQERIARFR